MKILITGCNGLLGQKLTAKLLTDASIQVIATARKKPATLPDACAFQFLDITDPLAVNRVIEKNQPDVLINTAAATHVDWCEQNPDACRLTNTTAVNYLAEVCFKNNLHLIQLSTDFIFNGTKPMLDETENPDPVNEYGRSKLAAEHVIQNSGVTWCILRTVLVYGVVAGMNRPNIVLWVKQSLEEGKNIRVVNDQYRTPTLAEDLATGCYLAALQNAKGVYHISGKDLLTPYDMAVQTADFFGLDKSLIAATDSDTFKQPARRPLKTGLSIEKARKELGYEPHSFREGLAVVKHQLDSGIR